MRDIIKNFLESADRKFIPLQVNTISIYVTMLKDFGYAMLELEDNTNGWDVDFWYNFANPEGKKLTLRGSLWYGNYSLEKVETSEDE